MIIDESVVFEMLSLTVHTLLIEKKPPLSLLSNWGACQEARKGSGDRQMMPELLNKAFSAKYIQQNPWKHHKEPYDALFLMYKWGMQQISW